MSELKYNRVFCRPASVCPGFLRNLVFPQAVRLMTSSGPPLHSHDPLPTPRWTSKGKVQCFNVSPPDNIIADSLITTSLYSFFKKGNPNKLAKRITKKKKIGKTTQCLVNKRSHPKSPHPLPCLSLASSAQETLVRWQLYKQHTKQ